MLTETVFHVTNKSGFDGIRKSGEIKPNQDKRFPFAFSQSSNSYGVRRGYVCLYDLRKASEDQIEEGLQKLYFLNPSNARNHPFFLIVGRSIYNKLIPWTAAKEEGGVHEVYIPYIECWYPGSLPHHHIAQILEVRVTRSPPDLGTLAGLLSRSPDQH